MRQGTASLFFQRLQDATAGWIGNGAEHAVERLVGGGHRERASEELRPFVGSYFFKIGL